MGFGNGEVNGWVHIFAFFFSGALPNYPMRHRAFPLRDSSSHFAGVDKLWPLNKEFVLDF